MRVGVVEDDLAEARFLFPRMSEGNCASCGRVVAECIDFVMCKLCGALFFFRAEGQTTGTISASCSGG